MAYTSRVITSNSGQEIAIQSINPGYYCSIHRYGTIDPPEYFEDSTWVYEPGVSYPSTIIDFGDFTSLPIYTNLNRALPPFYERHDESYYTLPSYQIYVEELNQSVKWIWGDYESGGLILFKNDVNSYALSLVNGFYSIDDTESGFGIRYFYNIETQPMTEEQLNNCIMGITIVFDEFALAIYSFTGDNKLCTFASSLLDFYYEEPQNTIPGIDACQFVGIGDPINPLQELQPGYVIIDGPGPKYITDIVRDKTSWVHISGDWTGNSEVDSEDNPFINGGASGEGGGWGDYPSRSDSIDFTNPENFAVDVLSSGILTLYNPTPSQMISFNQFLFSGITDSISNQLKKLTSDPLEYLLFVAMVHYNPTSAVSDEISYAGIPTGVFANKLSSQYKQLSCGSITISEATKSFLDYGGFSKVSIYLPYIGIEHLNIDDVMGATISVVYNINQLDGSCIAQVKCTRSSRRMGDTNIDSVLYHFNGNVFSTIPIFATDWRGTINSALGLIGGIGSIATGNVGGAVGSIASSVMQEKVTLNRSGSTSSSYGYMDNQKPYLILERPVNNIPNNYGHYEGYPSNIYSKISNINGYTEIDTDDIVIDNFDGITQTEFNKLVDILKGGIYL